MSIVLGCNGSTCIQAKLTTHPGRATSSAQWDRIYGINCGLGTSPLNRYGCMLYLDTDTIRSPLHNILLAWLLSKIVCSRSSLQRVRCAESEPLATKPASTPSNACRKCY